MNEQIRKQIEDTINIHKKMVAELEKAGFGAIADAVELITDSLGKGGRIYICGNGGSAADAQHIAGELVGRFTRERKAIPAMALNTDTSIITSIANDYSYEDVFKRQVEAHIGKNDILWAISTSGTSVNIIAAVKLAKQKGASILAFTGKTDSPLEKMADVCFCADSSSTARSQEIHQIAYHIICDLVEQNICE